jgi:tetratricopeptide (TPR) repeat protein
MIDEAIESYERDVQLNPNAMLRSWIALAGLYAQVGRDEESKRAAEEVLRIAPDYSWEKYGREVVRLNDKDIQRRFLNGLGKVGLK